MDYITMAIYSISTGRVYIKKPFEIKVETPRCYYTKSKRRFLKSEMNVAILRSRTSYPYIEFTMINGSEDELRRGLNSWFIRKATEIWSGEIDRKEK